jgi:hypothetical protein
VRRSLAAIAIVFAALAGLTGGLVVRLPLPVSSQAPTVDQRVATLESRVNSLEGRLFVLSIQTGAPVSIAPGQPEGGRACDIPPTPVVTTQSSGQDATITTIDHFNGVEGLAKETIVYTSGETITSYSIPAWLLTAYGGKHDIVVQEIESGRVYNRRSPDCKG